VDLQSGLTRFRKFLDPCSLPCSPPIRTVRTHQRRAAHWTTDCAVGLEPPDILEHDQHLYPKTSDSACASEWSREAAETLAFSGAMASCSSSIRWPRVNCGSPQRAGLAPGPLVERHFQGRLERRLELARCAASPLSSKAGTRPRHCIGRSSPGEDGAERLDRPRLAPARPGSGNSDRRWRARLRRPPRLR
jgi:hypothetical protein